VDGRPVERQRDRHGVGPSATSTATSHAGRAPPPSYPENDPARWHELAELARDMRQMWGELQSYAEGMERETTR
jgi:hypothetical protein